MPIKPTSKQRQSRTVTGVPSKLAKPKGASAIADVAASPIRTPKARAHPRGFKIAMAQAALAKADRSLARWMRKIGPLEIHWRDPFEPVDALTRAILYQQLSGKAAATIVARVEAKLPNGPHFHPHDLRDVPVDVLRGCGVSGNKVLALKDLAHKAIEGVVPHVQELRWLDNHTLIERLTAVRGIGRWTVEMMLMFRLGRPDALPVDDLGVRKGAQVVLGLADMPTPKQLAELGMRWAPWRTLASLYLWRVADFGNAPRAAVERSQDR
jgi:DNA-3-methyladenine glycosylase II